MNNESDRVEAEPVDAEPDAGDTVLRSSSPITWASIAGDLPGVTIMGMVIFTATSHYLGSSSTADVVALGAVAAMVFVLQRIRSSMTVVIRSDSVVLPTPLWYRRRIDFDDIERFKLHGLSEWMQARVAIERVGARARSFYSTSFKEYEIPLPGNASPV